MHVICSFSYLACSMGTREVAHNELAMLLRMRNVNIQGLLEHFQ